MLDIKFIRENKDIVTAGAKKKHIAFDADELIKTDDERRAVMTSIEKKRAEQNAMTERIAAATGPAGVPGSAVTDAIARQKMIDEMKGLKKIVEKEDASLKDIMKKWQDLMLRVPNVPDMSVPDGATDADNKEVKKWGDKPDFAKASPPFTPKDHVELMTALSMIDLDRGAKVHGFRGYYLTGDAVKLCFAIWNYALDFFSGKNFIPVMPPTIVRKAYLYGTGYLPGGEEDLYMTQDGDYLEGTAEVPLMGLHSEEILAAKDLPKRYLGFCPSFRREAGAHGKDVKGLIRVNEFYKFEQLILCEASHEMSVKFHEELNRNTEEFIESLGIPYHTVVNCGGDLGLGQVKKYDIELWVPKEGKYREISSASYFHDFQCRRLNIRYKDESGKSADGKAGEAGKVKYCHSLNSTAIPTPRILVSLVENFQQADGSIAIPKVLQKYFGTDFITVK
jgi:seryl-tRNA synthetase